MDLSSLKQQIKNEYPVVTAWMKNYPWWSALAFTSAGWLIRYGQDAVVGLFHRVF